MAIGWTSWPPTRIRRFILVQPGLACPSGWGCLPVTQHSTAPQLSTAPLNRVESPREWLSNTPLPPQQSGFGVLDVGLAGSHQPHRPSPFPVPGPHRGHRPPGGYVPTPGGRLLDRRLPAGLRGPGPPRRLPFAGLCSVPWGGAAALEYVINNVTDPAEKENALTTAKDRSIGGATRPPPRIEAVFLFGPFLARHQV